MNKDVKEAFKESFVEVITNKIIWLLTIGAILTLFGLTEKIGFLIIGFSLARLWRY